MVGGGGGTVLMGKPCLRYAWRRAAARLSVLLPAGRLSNLFDSSSADLHRTGATGGV
jgi:hypothetical protein